MGSRPPMTAPEHLANRDLDVAGTLPAAELPARARVAIVGGGIIGASIAYHLAAAGETDVVIVERGRLTNGTTWHAAGLVSQARGTHALTALAVGNADAYARIAAESGVDTGLRRNGSISLARTRARMDELLHGVSVARDFGIEVEIVGPDRVRDLWPGMAVDDLDGRHVLPQRRHREPGVRRARVRQGGGGPRRALRARDHGQRVLPRRRRTLGDRHRHLSRRDRGRDRGPRERPVDLGAGAARRRGRRAVPGRARVGDDRRDRPRGRDEAVRPRSRRVPVRPPLPGPAGDRRLRARRATAASGQGPGHGVRGARARLGSLRAGARAGPAADPGPRGDRVRALPAGARVVHPGRQPAARHGPRGPGAVRRRGPQLAGDHLRAGRRARGRRVDPGRPPHDGPRRGRRRAHRVVGHPAPVAPGADRRVAGQPVRHALAGQAAGDGARPPPAAAARRAPGGRGGVRAGRGLGTPAVVRAGRDRAGDPLRLRGPVVVRRRPRGGRGHAHGRRPVRPHDLLEVPRPGPGQRRRSAAPRDVRPRRRRRPDRLHGPRQRARRDRDGPDDHAPRCVHLPRPRADAQPAAHAGPAAQRAAGRRGRDRRHLGLRHAPPRGTSIARGPRTPDRRGPVDGGVAIPAGEADRGRPGGRLGVPRLVHGRARLGADGLDGARRRPLRARGGGGGRGRAASGRRVRLRGRPDRARLPRLGPRPGTARRPVRRGPRVHGVGPQAGRLRGPRRPRAHSRGGRAGPSPRVRPRPGRRPVARRVDAPRWRTGGPRVQRLDRADARRVRRPGLGPRPASRATGGSRSAASPWRAPSANDRSSTRTASASAADGGPGRAPDRAHRHRGAVRGRSPAEPALPGPVCPRRRRAGPDPVPPPYHARAGSRPDRVPAATAVRGGVRDAAARLAREPVAHRPPVRRPRDRDDGRCRGRGPGPRAGARVGGGLRARRHRRPDRRDRRDQRLPPAGRPADRDHTGRGRVPVQRRDRADPVPGGRGRDHVRRLRVHRLSRHLRDRGDRRASRSAGWSAASWP